MFTSPQSKSFLNQQSVKNRVLHEEYQLIDTLRDHLEQINKQMSKTIHTIQNQHRSTKELFSIRSKMNLMIGFTEQSQERLMSETILREKIKENEQKFFKTTMIFYEQKIKQLNAYLHRVEEMVQDLEQKGYLPYAQSVKRNNIIPSLKANVYYHLKKKLDLIQSTYKIFQLKKIKKLKDCEQKQNFMMGVQHFHQKKIMKYRQDIKKKIDGYTETNRKLKESIKEQKKQIEYESNGRKIVSDRRGKEEIIEYWLEMNQQLTQVLEKRSPFQMIQTIRKNRSKSEVKVKENEQTEEQEDVDIKICLKEIGNELTNSFMDQCSYLISDRFIVDEEDVNV